MNQLIKLLYMDLTALISIIIAGLGLFGTLLGFVIHLSTNVGRYIQQQEDLKAEIKDNSDRTRDKFADYYAFKINVSSQLSSIAERLESIQKDMKEIKDDIRGK